MLTQMKFSRANGLTHGLQLNAAKKEQRGVIRANDTEPLQKKAKIKKNKGTQYKPKEGPKGRKAPKEGKKAPTQGPKGKKAPKQGPNPNPNPNPNVIGLPYLAWVATRQRGS